jgi:hypothetical protein
METLHFHRVGKRQSYEKSASFTSRGKGQPLPLALPPALRAGASVGDFVRELHVSRLTITVRHMRFISYLAERLLQAVDESQRFLYE